jgi:hypothetical protein
LTVVDALEQLRSLDARGAGPNKLWNKLHYFSFPREDLVAT